MRTILSLITLAAVYTLSSCSYSRHPDSVFYDPNNTGFEYAPAMYHSYPYEPLTQVTNEDATSWHYNSTPYNDYDGKYKSNSLKPVEGTIARGKLDFYFPYEYSDAGRAQAGEELSNPVSLDNYSLQEGKRLYNLYCDHCHGEKGDGNGSLVEAGKIPPMGEYYGKLADRAAGSIYHTITLGKGIMGSHASQLSPDQRWLITSWVQIMQKGAEAYTTENIEDYHALLITDSADNTEEVDEVGSELETEEEAAVDAEAVLTDAMTDDVMVQETPE
ncbi:MAG: cytochrome c [Bacteroidia bacterium]